MTQANAERLKPTARKKSVTYQPRQFNNLTRGRFIRARQAKHLARAGELPTPAQVEMARSMAVLEWGALQGEHEGTMQSLREAREHRRLLLRVLADFERSLAAPPPKPAEPSLQDVLRDIASRRPPEPDDGEEDFA